MLAILDELEALDEKITEQVLASEKAPDVMSSPDEQTQQTLNELDSLIGELKNAIASLKEGEYDAPALESRLREVTELASRAASTLESVSR